MWQRISPFMILAVFGLSTLTLCIKLQLTKIFISLSLCSAVDEIFNRFDIWLWKIETWVQHVIWELPISAYRGGWLFGFNNSGTCARADRPAWHEIVADYTHRHTVRRRLSRPPIPAIHHPAFADSKHLVCDCRRRHLTFTLRRRVRQMRASKLAPRFNAY